MLKRMLALTLTVLLLAAPTVAQIESPKLTPTPPTEKQQALIRQGVALHDRGDYDGAISKYQEVLTESPDNVEAIYEMAFAHSMKKEYQKSLDLAYRGARYKSDLLAAFYQTIGNNLDQLGDSKKAVDVYKAGIKILPQDALLHYNLGVTYANMKKPEEARKSLKTALMINPKHPSSHLLLAIQFLNNGYRTPALFAAARFLILEPKTQRSTLGNRILHEVLSGGATQGKDPNSFNITLDMNAKKDEGDFTSIEMILGLSKMASLTEKNKDKSEVQRLVGQVETLLAVVDENTADKKQSSFVHQYYIPYFVELKRRGFVEPFVYYSLQHEQKEEVEQWLKENSGKVMQFLVFSNQYAWPKSVGK